MADVELGVADQRLVQVPYQQVLEIRIGEVDWTAGTGRDRFGHQPGFVGDVAEVMFSAGGSGDPLECLLVAMDEQPEGVHQVAPVAGRSMAIRFSSGPMPRRPAIRPQGIGPAARYPGAARR